MRLVARTWTPVSHRKRRRSNGGAAAAGEWARTGFRSSSPSVGPSDPPPREAGAVGPTPTRAGDPRRLPSDPRPRLMSDGSLRRLGARLVLRRGDVVRETVRLAREVGAQAVFASEDVSSYCPPTRATPRGGPGRRADRPATPAGRDGRAPEDLAPSGGDHYRVFGAYHRAWLAHPRRAVVSPPPLRGRDVESAPAPALAELVAGAPSPELPPGGETCSAARGCSAGSPTASGATRRTPTTSGQTPRRDCRRTCTFGCLSPVEVAERARRAGLRPAACLARLLPPAARRQRRSASRRPASPGRPLARRRRRAPGVAGREDRYPDRRRGHAPART